MNGLPAWLWAGWLPWILLLLLSTTAGCASSGRRIEAARSAYYLGDRAAARAELQAVADRRRGAAAVAQLDLAMVDLADGRTAEAMESLRDLRQQFDESNRLDPAGELLSIAADDHYRQFRPSGYEQVMIDSMLALCSLARADGDAESYALQAQMRQQTLARQAADRGLDAVGEVYQPLALAPYLRGVMRESSGRDYDDALRAYQLVSDIRPSFAPAQWDIQRCAGGVHSQAGHGVLYVIALVGRGPVLRQADAPVTSTALQIASQLHSASSGDRMLLPNLATVKVPQVAIPYSPVAALSLHSSSVWLGATQTLVDVGEMADRQCQAEMPWTLARAVVRRTTKEMTVRQATRTAGLGGLGGELARFATINAWSLSEQADTRCWGLLPREVQVLRAELPVGEHRIGITAVGTAGQPLGPASEMTVRLEDGRNSYLTAISGDARVHIVAP